MINNTSTSQAPYELSSFVTTGIFIWSGSEQKHAQLQVSQSHYLALQSQTGSMEHWSIGDITYLSIANSFENVSPFVTKSMVIGVGVFVFSTLLFGFKSHKSQFFTFLKASSIWSCKRRTMPARVQQQDNPHGVPIEPPKKHFSQANCFYFLHIP